MESLSEKQVSNLIVEIKGWRHENDKIIKEFIFNDFKDALTFIIRLGFEAEQLNHHPEINNVYNRVSIGLQTHDVGNKVSIKDIEFARSIEKIVSYYLLFK